MKYKVTVNETIIEELWSMIEDCAGKPEEDKYAEGFFTALHKSWMKNNGKKHWKLSLTLKQIKACREQAWSQADFIDYQQIATIKADFYNRYSTTEDRAEGKPQLMECQKSRRALLKLVKECDAILNPVVA